MDFAKLGRLVAIPKAVVAAVLERDGHRCVLDGPECQGVAMLADHRANRGMGGSKLLDDARNLIAACVVCNNWKEDTSGWTRAALIARGYRLRNAATAAKTLAVAEAVQVLYADGWHYLTADGRRLPAPPPDTGPAL